MAPSSPVPALNAEDSRRVSAHDPTYESNALHKTAVAEVLKSPTTHVPRLVTSRAGRHKVHGTGPVGEFNNRVGLMVTKGVGTMWAAYLFAALALISLPAAIASRSAIIIVAWIAQTFLQLVLLPIIIVGQNVQGRASDKRAVQTYQDAEAILHECLQLQAHLQQQDRILERIIGETKGSAPASA